MENKKKDSKTRVNIEPLTKERTQLLIGARGTLPYIEQDNTRAAVHGDLLENPIFLY